MGATEWRKSSYSQGGGTACVEVAWRKSSFSGGGGSNCVQVALGDLQTSVRDSKNTGPELHFPATSWHSFLHRPLSGS